MLLLLKVVAPFPSSLPICYATSAYYLIVHACELVVRLVKYINRSQCKQNDNIVLCGSAARTRRCLLILLTIENIYFGRSGPRAVAVF